MTRESPRPKRGRTWGDPILAEAAARFPLAFACFGSRPRPLKLRIEQDLREILLGVSTNRIREALRLYCGTRWYLEAIARGGVRVDLDGRVAGEVDGGARRRALDRLMEGTASPLQTGRGRPSLALKGEAALEVRLAMARSRGFRV